MIRAVAAALGAALWLAAVLVAQQPTGRIAGRLTAADTGLPIANALIQLDSPQLTVRRSANTDDDGRYEFTALEPGRYSLTAFAAYFMTGQNGRPKPPGTMRTIALAAGERRIDVDFVLTRLSVISGTLIDSAGKPIAGVEPSLFVSRYVGGRRRMMTVTTPAEPERPTDELGRFQFAGLWPGTYYVGIVPAPFKPGGATEFAATFYPGATDPAQAWPVIVRPGEDTTGVAFTPVRSKTVTLRGRLVDERDQPIQHGTVRLIDDRLGSPALVITARSTEDGRFEIQNVPRGEYFIVAQGRSASAAPRDFHFGQHTISVGDRDQLDLIVRLQAGAILQGRLVFEGTNPHPPAKVFFVTPMSVDLVGAAIGSETSSVINEDGTFAIGNLFGQRVIRVSESELWRLARVTRDGRDVTNEPIDFRLGSVSGIEVVYTDRVSSISGRVVDADGNPAADAAVVVFESDPAAWTLPRRANMVTRCGADGRYTLSRISAGRFYVIAVPIAEIADIDPDKLASWQAAATLISLMPGETKSIALKVVTR